MSAHKIYYCKWNGSDWTSGTQIPGLSGDCERVLSSAVHPRIVTDDRPPRLYVAYSYASDQRIMVASTADGANWDQIDQTVGGESKGNVAALAQFNDQLHCFVRTLGTEDPYIETKAGDGKTWSPPQKLEKTNPASNVQPATTYYQNNLYLIYDNFQGNASWMTYNRAVSAWSEPEFLAPAMVAGGVVYRNELLLYTRGGDKMTVSTYLGDRWESKGDLKTVGGKSISSPASANFRVFGDTLFMATKQSWIDSNDKDVLWATSKDGLSWSEQKPHPGHGPVSLSVFNGQLYLFYRVWS
jgi:hypothetical protein